MLAPYPSTRAVNACSSPQRSASSSSRSLTCGTVTPRILPRLLRTLPWGAKGLAGPCGGERLDQLGHAVRLAAQADLTCWQPPPRGRSRDELGPGAPDAAAVVFVCGPTAFVEAVATILVELGYPPERIRTERFGPTGG